MSDDHGGGGGQKALMWIGIILVGILALKGLASSIGFNANVGANGIGFTLGGSRDCSSCDDDEAVSPADAAMLRRAYK